MTVSRCLGPFADRINNLPRSHWKQLVDDQPEACPHSDCSEGAGCRAVCTEYAKMQWKIQVKLEQDRRSKDAPVTPKARREHMKRLGVIREA